MRRTADVPRTLNSRPSGLHRQYLKDEDRSSVELLFGCIFPLYSDTSPHHKRILHNVWSFLPFFIPLSQTLSSWAFFIFVSLIVFASYSVPIQDDSTAANGNHSGPQ